MGEQRNQPQPIIQPLPPGNHPTWRNYWSNAGQPWRTEPEIDKDRRNFLTSRVRGWDATDGSSYPFQGVNLGRADIEFLLSVHQDGEGPIQPTEPASGRTGLDLRGSVLVDVDLSNLPLTHLQAGTPQDDLDNSALVITQLKRARLAGAHLEGADLEGVNLDEADLRNAHLEGAYLTRARLRHVNLAEAHLEGAFLREAFCQGAYARHARMEGTNLRNAYLARADCGNAHLEGANLVEASLEGANLHEAHLEGANLEGANLRGANLRGALLAGIETEAGDLARVRPWANDFPSVLPPANLRRVTFDSKTILDGVKLGESAHGTVQVADIRWSDVNLAGVDWASIDSLGDETTATDLEELDNKRDAKRDRFEQYQEAVRAYRQLAVALQSQGLKDAADKYSYRALHLQRRLLVRRAFAPGLTVRERVENLSEAAFSTFLDFLAGYGYRPLRSVAAYFAIIICFAIAYYLIGQQTSSHVSAVAAVILSITSFHGRGLFPTGQLSGLNQPSTILAAVEATLGLLVEITFIAAFTRRFFSR